MVIDSLMATKNAPRPGSKKGRLPGIVCAKNNLFYLLVGAVCVFLLIGVIWAIAYTLLELLAPGSFAGQAAGPPAGWDSGWLYFSFVTLTTLGYGDILPVSGLARTLAYMEAVVGQFYVAVLVASLVSAYVSAKKSP